MKLIMKHVSLLVFITIVLACFATAAHEEGMFSSRKLKKKSYKDADKIYKKDPGSRISKKHSSSGKKGKKGSSSKSSKKSCAPSSSPSVSVAPSDYPFISITPSNSLSMSNAPTSQSFFLTRKGKKQSNRPKSSGSKKEGSPKGKTQVLVVVDMMNAYCDQKTCPWYDPVRDDGPGYSFTPRSWLGPACGDTCATNKDCRRKAIDAKPKSQRESGFHESIEKMKCEEGICACDSVPSEKDVISYITKIIGAKKRDVDDNDVDDSSYWDYIIFTHDWDDYGQVCSVGQGAKDNHVGDLYGLNVSQCWKQSAQHGSKHCDTTYNSTDDDNDFKQAGCTSSLVAWSKGSQIVEPIQRAVNKAFKKDSGMQSDRVIHVVKKNANWGLARHQLMNNLTAPQGKTTPYYLMEDLHVLPTDTRLTVTGSFTQYCVMAGVFQMVLSGFDDIVIAEAATGGYGNSQAVKLCKKGQRVDDDGKPCPIPPPSERSPVGEWSAWMADTGQGEGGFLPLHDSVNNVQTTKSNALLWMEDIGLTVKKSEEGAPLENGWNEYTDWMYDQGVSIPQCFVQGWC